VRSDLFFTETAYRKQRAQRVVELSIQLPGKTIEIRRDDKLLLPLSLKKRIARSNGKAQSICCPTVLNDARGSRSHHAESFQAQVTGKNSDTHEVTHDFQS
jgi:hypothetical protein